MGTLSQDFRYGLRMLRKQPGFTAVAVLTLALAIGANTAIFSIVYPVLLRPLPFANPAQLVTVGEGRQKVDCCFYAASYPDYLDWKTNAKSFQSLAGYGGDAYTITGNGEPKTVFAAMVTPNFFSTLGVTPVLGRDFLPGEDLPSGQGPNVALLTYDFWRSDFGGDRKIIGRAVRLDGKPVTIVGILPRNFELNPAGILPIWVPLHLNNYERTARDAHWFSVIGRLAPGVTLEQAGSEMTAIGSQLARQYPSHECGRSRYRRVSAASDCRRHPSLAAGVVLRGGFRAADCLRQRGQPDVQPLRRSPARVRGSHGAGRQPVAPRPATAHRKSDALAHGSGHRLCRRGHRHLGR